jgi:alkanesulfonate monooxygenase SsuD/methylene tetrahydromethanopterin reductase-like flavin-dependent oxidoreductase (luciferase family)
MGDVLDDVEAALAARYGDAGTTAGDSVERINRRLAALKAASSELDPDDERRRRAGAAQGVKQP